MTRHDPFAAGHAVADAVLYEGYVLYPYRASARKNQVRWQFGVLVPPTVAEGAGERSAMRTEVLVDPGDDARLSVRVRCLQVQHRDVEVAEGEDFVAAEAVEVDGTPWVAWDEAVEHQLDVEVVTVLPVPRVALREIDLPATTTTELLTTADGRVAGRAIRTTERVTGLVRVTTAQPDPASPLVKVVVEVANTASWAGDAADRDAVIARSLVAVHTLLAVDGGAFVSLLDPPAAAVAAVKGCRNEGTFPVLVGPEGDNTVVLSSPIILYDHPAVAPESAGDFCDATEIDEILALRVLTLTDAEKAEARGTDPRAAAIVDRCDGLPPEVWERLHGAVRSLQPVGDESDDPAPAPAPEAVPWWDPGVDGAVDPWSDTTWVGGVEVGKGTSVRLCPSRRADAHDLFLAGRTATVAGVFRDVDGDEHLAVTLDDDPASELFEWQGRYLYFHPEEVEVLVVTSRPAKVLVAGIGNIFLGDDGFGVEVANRLSDAALPEGVRVEDYGIRGVHLAYELLEGYDALVLVDAVPLGEAPGTVAILEPTWPPEPDAGDDDPGVAGAPMPAMDAHSMNPVVVLSMLDSMGGRVERVLVVGCEPSVIEEGIGLSTPVAAAVDRAVDAVLDLVAELCLPTEERSGV